MLLLFKINTIITQTAATQRKVSGTKLWSDWRAFQGLLDDPENKQIINKLPSINRDLRVIFGKLPMARGAINVYNRLIRLQTRAGILKASEGPDVMLAKLNLVFTVAASLLILITTLQRQQKKMETERIQYESWIRREANLNKREFESFRQNWRSYKRSRP